MAELNERITDIILKNMEAQHTQGRWHFMKLLHIEENSFKEDAYQPILLQGYRCYSLAPSESYSI